MPRAVRSLSFVLALVAIFAGAGCDEVKRPGVGVGGGAGGGSGSDAGQDCGGLMSVGCACAPGTQPVSCYTKAERTPEGQLVCGSGTRYCNGGAWTACEDIRDFVLDMPKGLGEPAVCNVCDPGCVEQSSTPVDSDLTPGNSEGVHYDPNLPGITISPSEVPAGLEDGDGDGVPDVGDECVGPGHKSPCDGSTTVETEGFAFTLSPGETAGASYPRLRLQLNSVDYYVLMDTSSTMSEEIGALQDDLISGTFVTGCPGGILGAIRCKLPNTAFGVGMIREYPRGSTAGGGQPNNDAPYYHLLDPTLDFNLAQDVVDSLSTDMTHIPYPEGTSQALYAMATGRGLGPWLPGRDTCAAGGRGYPCFRAGSIPVILVITDAPMQGGPQASLYPYNDRYQTVRDWATTPNSKVPMSLFDQPPVITRDTAGLSIYERANANRPFELGDLTNRSVTVSGTTIGTPLTTNRCPTSSATSSRSAPQMRFTLTQASTISIDTNGSEFDTVIGLLKDDGVSYHTNQSGSCNDTRATGLVDPNGAAVYPDASQLRFSLAAGTYRIVLRGYRSSDDGAYQLRVRNESAAGSLVTSAPTPQSWSATAAALQALGAKTIGIAPCEGERGDIGSQCPDAVRDLQTLGVATSSINSATAQPFVYKVSSSASAFSATIVDATMQLANHLRLDIRLGCRDNLATPENECTLFAVSGTPVGGSCPATCTGGYDGTSCLQCAPGSVLDFDMAVQNVGVTPTVDPQVFEFEVALLGDGSVMSSYPIQVVVPGTGPAPEPTTGYFEIVYSSPDMCDTPHKRPRWGEIGYDVVIPAGASVIAEVRGAGTLDDLAAAPFATVALIEGAPGTDPPLDVGAALRAAGLSDRELYLAIRFVLRSDAQGVSLPGLRTFDFSYHCEDFE